MSIFNLAKKSEIFCKKYVEAMGYQRQENRPQYRWWNLEDLLEGEKNGQMPPNWNEWASMDPSLTRVFGDAKRIRYKWINKISKLYGPDRADGLVRTYIGYHPSYGGYICQIGPYSSKGYRHGEDAVVQDATHKFGYYVFRRRKPTKEEIAKSLIKNIQNYRDQFGIEFTPDDFTLTIKPPADDSDPDSDAVVESREAPVVVDGLNPSSPNVQRFFDNPPVQGEGSTISVNERGKKKIEEFNGGEILRRYAQLIKDTMGSLYQEEVNTRAKREGKTPEQVEQEMLTDLDILRKIYQNTAAKYKKAVKSGEASVIGMPEPPPFIKLYQRSGAQQFTKVPTNELQAEQLRLRREILLMLKSNPQITSQEIAEKLNSDPRRVAVNKLRERQGKEPISISDADISGHVSNLKEQMSGLEGGNNPKTYDRVVEEISNNISELEGTESFQDKKPKRKERGKEKHGFDDFKTAIDLASLYFSGLPVDRGSGAKLGVGSGVDLFSTGPDFKNVSSSELMNRREVQKKIEENQKATEKDIGKFIGIKKSPQEIPTEPQAIPPEETQPAEDKTNIDESGRPIETTPAVETTPEKSRKPSDSIKIEDLENLIGKTVNNLIKIAEELDEEGKDEAAEEVHKVIRKYIGRM